MNILNKECEARGPGGRAEPPVSSTALAKIKEARRRVERPSFQLPRCQSVPVSAASRLSKSCTSTTAVLSVLSQIQKENLRKFCQGKKYKPLDSRRLT